MPTDVPMLSDMKQAAAKRLGIRNCEGSTDSVSDTVASIEPTPLASAEKAPAIINIQIIYSTSLFVAPRVNTSMRSATFFPRMLAIAQIEDMMKASDKGIL